MEDPAVRGGRRGGEEALHSEKVSAAQLAMYLKGISFPADRQKIASTAMSNGAPDNVMQYINKLPSRQYGRANEIEAEFGKIKNSSK